MLIKVKSITQRQEEFEVNDLEQLVSDFAKLVCDRFNYSNGVKLIYAGRILLHTEKLSNYFTEGFTGYIVCMEEKKKQEVQSSQNITINNPTIQPQQNITINNTINNATTRPPPSPPSSESASETASVASDNQLSSLDHNRAMIFTFMRLFSSVRLLNYLFFTTPDDVNNMIRDGDFDDLIQQVTLQTETIHRSLATRENNMIDITFNNVLHENLLNSIINPVITAPRNHTYAEHRVESEQQTQTQRVENQANQDEKEERQEERQEQEEQRELELTEQDRQNIQMLVSFGYNEQQAIFAYLMSNKNLDAAANILMDI